MQYTPLFSTSMPDFIFKIINSGLHAELQFGNRFCLTSTKPDSDNFFGNLIIEDFIPFIADASAIESSTLVHISQSMVQGYIGARKAISVNRNDDFEVVMGSALDVYPYSSIELNQMIFSKNNKRDNMQTTYVRAASDIGISVFELFDAHFGMDNRNFVRSFMLRVPENQDRSILVSVYEDFIKNNINVNKSLRNVLTDYTADNEERSSGLTVSLYIGKYNDIDLVIAQYVSNKYDQMVFSIVSDQEIPDLESKLVETYKEYKVKVVEPSNTNFFMVERNDYGFGLKEFKLNTSYNDDFIETHFNDDFKSVSSEIMSLVSNNGKGIVLLHGIPGTGKTNYIKYIANKEKARKLVYLPTYMISSLTDPSFLEFLTSKLAGSVIVFEDAESAITSRESNASDSNAVSTILNITDGLLGETLNCLIICSFNTDLDYIDKALVRPGRMKVRYEFGKLRSDKADQLLNTLNKTPQGKDLTVADIYNTITEVKNARPTVSFGFTK